MATVQNVNNNSGSNNANQKTNNNELGKDQFLKMLITQLRYQDPLSPMDDTAFVAQMAQFSSLEQMQNMSATMTNLQATNMVGKPINWADAEGNVKSGTVDAIKMVNGTPKLVVGEVEVDLASVIAVGTMDDIVQMAQLANMTNIQAMTTIGKKVTWTDADGVTQTGVVEAVSMVNGNAKLVVNGTNIDFAKVTKIENA